MHDNVTKLPPLVWRRQAESEVFAHLVRKLPEARLV